jgi:hypothetical protein
MKTLKWSVTSLLLAVAAWAADPVVTKEATGEAAIIGNDEQKALEKAKDAALRLAVEQVAGVQIDADSAVVNSVLVRDAVYANTSGYVKKYDIVSKKKEKGVMIVTVRADIGTAELDKDISAAKALIKRFGRPSIIFLLQEQAIQVVGDKGAVTTSDHTGVLLSNAFKADGWDVKDAAFANGKLKLAAGATFGAAEAKEVGDISKAAYIVYGNVIIRHQDPGSMGANPSDGKQVFFPVTGEYDLTLFATASGSVISKVSGKLVMDPQISRKATLSYERTAMEVIERQKKEIIDSIRKGALEFFRNNQMNGSSFVLNVANVADFAFAKKVKASFQNIKGVKELQQEDFKNNKLQLKITYLGTPSDLADALENASIEKKKVSVTGVTANSIDVGLK